MKTGFIKIASIFFLTVLLASNVVNLHVYFHEQAKELGHLQNDGNDSNSEIPCDLCYISINLNNLDFDNTPEFSFKVSTLIQHVPAENIFGNVELFYKQLYLNNNRNKAPPYLV